MLSQHHAPHDVQHYGEDVFLDKYTQSHSHTYNPSMRLAISYQKGHLNNLSKYNNLHIYKHAKSFIMVLITLLEYVLWEELEEKQTQFRETFFAVLCKIDTKSIESARKHAPNKHLKPQLRYTEQTLTCIHDGKK